MRDSSISSPAMFLLWFGAAVSVAEIMTGGLLADLGLKGGLCAILLGHLAGIVPLGLAALLGHREGLPSVMSTRISFGRQGSYLVSVLNILQLVGWTAVMVQQGGSAAAELAGSMWGASGGAWAMLGVAGLVGLWVWAELRGARVLNGAAVILLLGLSVVLSVVVMTTAGSAVTQAGPAPGASFGAGFELSIIMPLSWFPLVADYASRAATRRGAWLWPCAGYLLGSSWMYAIGLVGALGAGSADPSHMMLASGLGGLALVVVVLATVTTTYLDVFSAAVSAGNIWPRASRRALALAATGLGAVLALTVPGERYLDFLYLLGSAFSPLVAILLADYFLLKTDNRQAGWDWPAMLSLGLGITFYHSVKSADLVTGPTLATILATWAVHSLVRLLTRAQARRLPINQTTPVPGEQA